MEWPARENFNPGKFYMSHAALVDAPKVFLPVYITLGLVKNFVNAMDHQGEGFKHIGELFFYKTEAKIKQDILVGPELDM